MSRFSELGFPTTRMEDWRNTSVKSIAKAHYRRSVEQPEDVTPEDLAPYLADGAIRVVILNGRFSSTLSSLEGIPETVEIKSLGEAFHGSTQKLEPYLGRIADYSHHAFVALNTAFMEDGVFLYVPENQVVDRPIHLMYLFIPLRDKALFHPRNLIYAGPNSQATVMEHYIGLDKESRRLQKSYFTNHVTELVMEDNSSFQHIKLQEESGESDHISTIKILQRTRSTLSTVSVSMGGALTRNDVTVVLEGEGCNSTMSGLVLAREDQHVDNHTFVHHMKPHCTSHQLYKGIYGGRSHGVFNGRILVHQDAQKTNADQANRNLLLSRDALVHSNPQLEINADDVRCTHGSTTGQVDEESVFYLRSRGLNPKMAHFLLIQGFATEIIDSIGNESVRNNISQLLSHWLTNTVGR